MNSVLISVQLLALSVITPFGDSPLFTTAHSRITIIPEGDLQLSITISVGKLTTFSLYDQSLPIIHHVCGREVGQNHQHLGPSLHFLCQQCGDRGFQCLQPREKPILPSDEIS